MTKVLILDQSKSVRNILRERLEYEGFSAEAVENEAAASALCERIPFDVILSDTECKALELILSQNLIKPQTTDNQVQITT